ncbi:MAG: hypothetical protein E7361_03220 [Clostridiales bacterium]|nr:hypothetical protein [Clostridiales bacterium]
MKKLTKVVACAGVVLGMSGALVGCSNLEVDQAKVDKLIEEATEFAEKENAKTEATISQEDLDQIIANANKFFNADGSVKDNIIVGEEAKALLDKYLLESAMCNSDSYELIITGSGYDSIEDKGTMSQKFQVVNVDGVIKGIIYNKDGEIIDYEEMTKKEDGEGFVRTYYDIGAKTYTISEDNNPGFSMDFGGIPTMRGWMSLLIKRNVDQPYENCIMEVVDEDTIVFTTIMQAEEGEYRMYKTTFEGGRLVKNEEFRNDQASEYSLATFGVQTMEFNEGVEDIVFDKTGYTEATNN